MDKIAAKDVTETIAYAMEHADKMEHVLIIYANKTTEQVSFGFFQDEELKVETANYLCDVFKSWMFNSLGHRES